MPGNTSHTFFDQLVEVIEQAQKEAEAAQMAQRASQADVDKARREMAREKMEAEKAEKEKAAKSAPKPMLGDVEEETKSPLGEKFDARKMVIYSEIMNPKYKD